TKPLHIGEKTRDGLELPPPVMPSKTTAIGNNRLWIFFVQKEMAEVNAMTHPLIADAAGKVPIQTKFEIELRIERPVRLSHQPGAPIRVLLANLLHLGT